MLIFLILALFITGYVLISFEQRLLISKSATAMLFAGILWILIAVAQPAGIANDLTRAGSEIFEITLFLLSAMTLVQILVHYKFFEAIRYWLVSKRLNQRRLLWLISALAFVSSAIIDNLTTSIIFAQLSRLFFKGKSLLAAVALVIISANAGGAFSPIGDVTTTLLWLRGKFSAGDAILYGLVPSLVVYLVSAFLLITKVDKKEPGVSRDADFGLLRSEKLVIAFALGSFALPFIFHEFGLKPYMGLLTGLGLTWLLIDLLKRRLPSHESHFTASIEHLLQEVDVSTLMFFVGILLSVSALSHVGILNILSNSLFGQSPSQLRLIAGSSIMGVLSSLVDNVPLTAAAISIVKTQDPSIWVLIALAVGTGGSMLVIGSAAGIVAMGIVRELDFVTYVKVAGLPAALGYICGIGVWYLQRLLLT